MGLTPEQAAVLDAGQRSVFVSAAAGSGKTSLLVERYVRWAVDDGVPLERLPTVTFTRRAAAELKDRIRSTLAERGRPDLAWSLETAPIGTIHSLCARLLREHPVEAGLDPEFTLLDEDASLLLRSAVWDEVWTASVLVASPEEAVVLAEFQRELRGDVVSLHDRLRGRGHESPRFPTPEPADLEQARAEALACLGVARGQAAPFTSGIAAKNLGRLDQCLEWLPHCRPTLASLRRSKGFFPQMNCAAGAKPAYEEVRLGLSDFRRVLVEQTLAPLAATVDRLLPAFHQAYEERKLQLGVLDFADLELRALRLLETGVRPYAGGGRLMVDEFQDTNGLQCGLLDLLGHERLLTVGDYHQSIYGFRGADPHVFLEREQACRRESAEAAQVCRLSVSFRSRAPVVDVVNRVFSHPALFGPGFTGLRAHRETDAPRKEDGPPRGTLAPAVEVRLLDPSSRGEDDQSVRAAEARGVAERIRALVQEEGWAPRDVVVLLRSFTHVESFEQALEGAGVPAYVVGGRGYYAREEVTDLLALFRVLVNPYDDVALLTALRSPLGGVSDDLLYLLRRQQRRAGEEHLWPVVRGSGVADADESDQGLLTRFADRVEYLRPDLGRPGLPGLIERCLEVFDYDLVVLGAPGGRRRFANVRKLQLFASAFEEVEGPDLGRFVAHLAGRTDLGAQEGSAAVLAEHEDVVRIMTVHKAKGLEFPVVVLAGLGKTGHKGSGSPFLVGRDGQVGFCLGRSLRHDCEQPFGLGPVVALLEEQRREEAEEEKRLVYVAVTRAEERAILTGVAGGGVPADDPLAGMLQALEDRGPVDDLDLVVEPLLLPPTPALDGPEQHQPRGLPDLAEPAPPPPPFLTAPAGWAIAGPVSFSALHLYAQCPRRYYLERVLRVELPEEPAGDGGQPTTRGGHDEPDGRALGTLVHQVLEVLDLGRQPTPAELQDLVDATVAASPDGPSGEAAAHLVAEAVPLVLSFWSSPAACYEGIERAEREVPFSFAHGETLVTGVYDLLLRGEQEWRILDYKTNRLEGRSRAAVVEEYRLQAQVYALAALLAGAPRVTVGFLLLRDPSKTEDVTYLAADRDGLSGVLDEALAGLRAAHYPAAAGSQCVACSRRELCQALVPDEEGR